MLLIIHKELIAIVACLLLLTSCRSLDKEVKEIIGGAKPRQQEELTSFINHYANDKERQEVAKFLVANMLGKRSVEGHNNVAYQTYIDSIDAARQTVNSRKGYNYKEQLHNLALDRSYTETEDLSVVKADSLIRQTDAAFQQWERTPWANLYSNEVFKQYIAPYRIADEPLEYDWRMDAYARYKYWLQECKDSGLVAACSYIYQHLAYQTNNLFWGEPLQSYSANVKYRQGTCSDYAVYTTMVMRALGIPTAIDFVPYWGDNNNGHSFNSLLLPDGTCKGYNNKEDLANGLTLSGKVPKVYRKVYEVQRNSLLYKHRNTEYIPDVFAQHDVIDVTSYYDIPVTDVTIVPKLYTPQSHIVYLSVFSPQKWCPVAWTEYKNNRADFRHVGVGYTSHDSPVTKGESYGVGCLFLPVCYQQGEMQPLNFPFILKEKEVPRYLIPDSRETETVVLHRKFPRKKRIIDFAKRMRGGYFELSNDRNFAQPDLIYCVDSIPDSYVQTIPLAEKKRYRYMRFYKRNGGISVGELGCLDAKNQIVAGKVLADAILMEDTELKNICDGDASSYFDIGNLKDTWVGLDFGKPVVLNALFFCSRTDDNDVSNGDEYELFYWNNEWISLGRQTGSDNQLVYKNVPENALLWLRNLTKGKEERPFTYENGKQIWW